MVGTNNNNLKEWHRGGGDSKYRKVPPWLRANELMNSKEASRQTT